MDKCTARIKAETNNQYAFVGMGTVSLDGTYTVEQLRKIADLLEKHLEELKEN